jgi:hypothetical protein
VAEKRATAMALAQVEAHKRASMANDLLLKKTKEVAAKQREDSIRQAAKQRRLAKKQVEEQTQQLTAQADKYEQVRVVLEGQNMKADVLQAVRAELSNNAQRNNDAGRERDEAQRLVTNEGDERAQNQRLRRKLDCMRDEAEKSRQRERDYHRISGRGRSRSRSRESRRDRDHDQERVTDQDQRAQNQRLQRQLDCLRNEAEKSKQRERDYQALYGG